MKRGWARFLTMTPAVALLLAAVLIVVGTLLALRNERAYDAQKVRDMAAQARIIAATATAALSFGDVEAAQEYLDALAVNPLIDAAAVYDSGGRSFARFVRTDDASLPVRVDTESRVRRAGGKLVVVVPVMQGETTIGAVYLRTAAEPLRQLFARHSGIALLIVMASLMVAALAGAQTALARANAELGRRADALGEANAELRTQIAEREKIEAQLHQAQKMESIGQLTGGVAHDFNNLLTIIVGSIERLQRRIADGSPPGELSRAADSAMDGAHRAAMLTRSLLAFSRRQPLDPKPVDPNRLVTHMSDLLRRTLGEHVKIETVLAGGLWRTNVDPNQLENAILNLAVNARDAMPNGGRLTIETANAYLDERYAREEDIEPGQYVVIAVSDTGTGMSKDLVEKAFEPFFTTKDTGHGTGLGLSQVYGFIKQSGGHVKIYSELGEGTAVKIYLPRLLAEEEPVSETRQAPHVAAGGERETVLVVEDEDAVRAQSVEMLSELGYRVLEAQNGAAGLRVLEQHPDVALLFTDVGLPGGMNGRQLADEAQRRSPGLKVLFTTGYARNAIVHDGRLDPGVRLLTKPFTYSEVATALRNALNEGSASHAVLVVEDEALIRLDTVEVLEGLGFDVLEATTAGEALRAARGDDEIAAAVIDVGLPDRRGDALAAELRALHADMRIVIATGQAEDGLDDRFAADPLTAILRKPYAGRALTDLLRELGVRLPKS